MTVDVGVWVACSRWVGVHVPDMVGGVGLCVPEGGDTEKEGVKAHDSVADGSAVPVPDTVRVSVVVRRRTREAEGVWVHVCPTDCVGDAPADQEADGEGEKECVAISEGGVGVLLGRLGVAVKVRDHVRVMANVRVNVGVKVEVGARVTEGLKEGEGPLVWLGDALVLGGRVGVSDAEWLYIGLWVNDRVQVWVGGVRDSVHVTVALSVGLAPVPDQVAVSVPEGVEVVVRVGPFVREVDAVHWWERLGVPVGVPVDVTVGDGVAGDLVQTADSVLGVGERRLGVGVSVSESGGVSVLLGLGLRVHVAVYPFCHDAVGLEDSEVEGEGVVDPEPMPVDECECVCVSVGLVVSGGVRSSDAV